MTCHVVVEGEMDQRLMERLLRPAYGPQEVNILRAGGLSRLTSLARTLLATRHEPVVVILDADAVNERGVSERRAGIEEALGQFAGPKLFRVMLFVPDMAAILFHDEKVLAEMTGGRALTTEERVRAEYEPRKVLERILQERGLDPRAGIRTAVEHLDPKAVSDFPVVKELGELLRGRFSQAA